MNLQKIIAGTTVASIVMTASVFASDLTAPANIKQTSATDDSVTISWDKVPKAFAYYIYWGETDTSNIGELVTDTTYTLTGLEKGKSYKIAVAAVDEESNESPKSVELDIKTGAMSSSSSKNTSSSKQTADKNADFAISRIEILSAKEINLVFTRNLEKAQDISSQIILEDDKGTIIDLKNIDFGTNPNTLVAALGKDLQTKTDYKVTILDLKDALGNVIENGIDAVTSFTTPESFVVGQVVVIDAKEKKVTVKTSEELQKMKEDEVKIAVVPVETPKEQKNQDKTQDKPKEELPELDAASPEEKVKQGLTKDPEVKETATTQTAKNAEKLPEAGAGHIFLLFMALLSAGGFAMYSSKKEK